MHPVILVQLFQESPVGISSLEIKLSQKLADRLICLDNFSDSQLISYALKTIEKNESLSVVIWEHSGGQLKGILPLLHALLKKKSDIDLLTNSNQLPIRKLTNLHGGKYLQSESELQDF